MPTNESEKTEMRNVARRRLALLALVILAPLVFTACPKNDGPTKPQPNAPTAPSSGVAFNGERALDHVRKQMDIGPRIPGSPELARTREYIWNELKTDGLSVTNDEFHASTPLGEKDMINITAEIPGESKDVIIISSHYDSKYYQNMRFVGANDPGSSVGTLLEMARVLAANNVKPKLTYWLVFFDGEEAFCESWDECGKPGAPDNTYGSRRYVEQLQSKKETNRVRALILLDMMGYKSLELGRDTMSTKWMLDIVWQTARDLGHGSVFVNKPEGVGGDDHEPFLRAGIDSLDLIQLNGYPYWHTVDDTFDKISPDSMKIVGDVVIASLPKIAEHLKK